jgi:hypothetical protein
MHLTKIAVCGFVMLFSSAIVAQPSKISKTVAPSKPATAPSYRQRVETISNELKMQTADLWQIEGKLEELNSTIAKLEARSGEPAANDREEWSKLKTALGATVQGIRNNTKRLRSISPVPRSLKKIDTEFVDASFELEEGLDSLVAWTNTPSPEMNLQLGRQLRKGITTWSNALIALNCATDSAVTTKVYTEN